MYNVTEVYFTKSQLALTLKVRQKKEKYIVSKY